MMPISEEISHGTITSNMHIDAASIKSGDPMQEYDPKHGFDIHFDYCSRLFNLYPSLKLVYTIQNKKL